VAYRVINPEEDMIDISTDAYIARMAIVEACAFIQAPSVLYKPAIFKDGNQWCALYGENLQEGVAGFGDTPWLACQAFNLAWGNERAIAPSNYRSATPS
jgi:hypothetical protein